MAASVGGADAAVEHPVPPKSRRANKTFGGLLEGNNSIVVLLDSAATSWLCSVRSGHNPDYKVNKTYNPVQRGSIRQQINPLSVVMQVAALTQQGTSFPMEQLATDLLHMHDPATVQPMLSADSQESLEERHALCVSHFADWLAQMLTDHPVSSFLAATSRTQADLTIAAGLPGTLTAAEQRLQQVHSLLQFIGRRVHLDDRQSQQKDWFQLVEHGRSLQGSFVRNLDIQVAEQQQKLLTEMQSLMTGNPCFAELMQDSARTSTSDAAYMQQLSQQVRSQQDAPSHCWRLIAMCQQHDVWVNDVQPHSLDRSRLPG